MQNWQLIRDGKLDKQTFVQRARILDLIREWFRKEGFLEVETPLMVKHPGMEPHLNLFSSEFISEEGQYSDKRYLHTSPEYSMKKLLGAGFEKIFQISKVFRNGELGNADFLGCTGGKATAALQTPDPLQGEPTSPAVSDKSPNYCVQVLGENESRHNPEFTMMEWYRGNSGYEAIMDDCERMIKFVVREMELDSSLFPFRPKAEESLLLNSSQEISPLRHEYMTPVEMTKKEWERLTVREAFQRYADLNLDELRDEESLRAAVQKKGYEMTTNYTWDDLFFLVLLNEIEPHLGKEKPQFLIDYPASQAALAKKKPHSCGVKERVGNRDIHFCEAAGYMGGCEAEWAERFELYINGLELCNAFGELVDPVEQRLRLEEEQQQRKEMGKEVYPIDEKFIEALKTMPPSGGNALGIDRLVMVLLGKKSIEEVLLFPWGDVS